jgi:Tfp pilus assembly protein PilO
VLNIAIIALALFLSFNFYKNQITTQISHLSQSIDTEKKKNTVLQQINKLEENFALYKNFTHTNKDRSTFMASLGSIADSSSVKILSLNPLKEEGYPLYTRHPFSLSIMAANYHALGKFISLLESSSDLYSIDALVIKPQQTQKDSVTYNMAVDIKLNAVAFKD